MSHTHTIHGQKKIIEKMLKLKSNQEIKYKNKTSTKEDGGVELYGHTYMLIVGKVHLFRLQSIKKFMHNSSS